MFLSAEQSRFTVLFQGDIVSNVPLLGAIDANSAVAIGSNAWGVDGKLETGHVAVLSHSCEVSSDNGIKVTSCIIAPVRDVSSATPPDKLQLLIDSNDVRPGQPTFLKYFYLPPSPQIGHVKGSVVDFSKMFSVRKTSIEMLVAKKALEMSPAARQMFSKKLGLYFFRE